MRFDLGLGSGLAAGVLLLSSLGCGQRAAPIRGCSSDPECGGGAFCRDGTCASSQAPTAQISAPSGPLLSHVRLPFDGGASSDPDPGDRVVAWSWSARAVTAPCEPVQTSGADAAFSLLVSCGGSFELTLEVTDSHGVKSPPVRSTVEVAAHASPPSATLAGPTSLQHRCGGSPLSCAAVDDAERGTFALQATAASPAGGSFTWRWSARPPASLPTAPRIAFSPADGASPTVSIETSGTPIAGEYTIVAEAADALGFVAAAELKVMVGNRPPESRTSATTLSLPHTYDANPPRYLAQGSIAAFEVVDPDGDPLTTAYAAEETGVKQPSLRILATGTEAAIDIAVPAADPASLIGPSVSRFVRFRAEDGNGGALVLSWPVVVLNRAPRRVGSLGGSADHTFDPAALRYRAAVPVATYVDDDGDPLTSVVPTGDAVCAAVAFSGSQVEAACSLPFTGVPDAGAIAKTRSIQLQVADPWATLDPATASVVIGNRPPVIGAPRTPAAACVATEECCLFDGETQTCRRYVMACGASSATQPSPVSDPDGDPMFVTYQASGLLGISPASEVCSPSCGGVTVSVAEHSTCGGLPSGTFAITASDGSLVTVR